MRPPSPARPALVLAVAVALLAAYPGPADAATLGQWTPTTSYPLQIAGDSCVVFSDVIYCMGGFDTKGKDYDNTYYAPLSATGIGPWKPTAPYPAPVDTSSCVASGATVYCVGGENSTSVLSYVYQATLSPSGIGTWTQAAAYPQTIAAPSCVVYSGYIYCIGGIDLTGDETASTYYASLSGGLGSWMGTTPYPFAINSEGCVVQGGYVYCVAGNEESGLPQFPVADVYYAQLSSSGIGTWTQTTAYPEALSALSCALYSSYIYCAGGFDLNEISSDHAYVGAISQTGVSSWTNATAYPSPFDVSSCVSDFASIYCVAGRSFNGKQLSMSNADYYAPLLGVPPPATSTTTASSVSTTSAVTATSSSTTSVLASASATSTSTSARPTLTTTTAPEFGGAALVSTTLFALVAVVLLLRVRRPGLGTGRP